MMDQLDLINLSSSFQPSYIIKFFINIISFNVLQNISRDTQNAAQGDGGCIIDDDSADKKHTWRMVVRSTYNTPAPAIVFPEKKMAGI